MPVLGLSANGAGRDRRASEAASRRRGRAFPPGGALCHPADDGQSLLDRLDRDIIPRAGTARARQGKIPRRAAAPLRRFPRIRVARRTGLALSAVLQPCRALYRAAHAIHPMAGQGLDVGICAVASLAGIAVDARRLGLDIGTADLLGSYERWRRFDAVTMAAITEGLNQPF